MFWTEKLLETNLEPNLLQRCFYFLYFDIFTSPPTLNLGSFSLFPIPKSIYLLELTLTGLALTVLWYVLLYSL